MTLRPVELTDRFTAETGVVLTNGAQALLLALIRQRRFDRARGLDTAGFLSGYRGSPLASLDSEAERHARHLEANDIVFTPGVNEDLALTAVWGTQQTALDPKARVSGVFGMWYGKGAGLDRCGDALRHAHGAGSSRMGGVLVVAGDDHALKSSSQAYHSEPTFIDMQMPVLAPADMQDVIDFALLGWEMSRFSGCYVGFKVLAEHVNATALVDIGLERARVAAPELPAGNDRWIRWPDPWPAVEKRLLKVKLPAALDFARANGINRIVCQAPSPRLGVAASGKNYRDVVQALALAGVTLEEAPRLGISILKIGMPWPADDALLRDFCARQERVLVVEEKRDLIETQIRNALYGQAAPPPVLGRRDRAGRPRFSQIGELEATDVLRAILEEIELPEATRARAERAIAPAAPPPAPLSPRSPYFCSGCPHNRSTVVPEGSRALAGVGCHFMAVGMARETETFTQMGGEGAPWIGAAPFTETGHVFVNLGEGTYFHSGSLAIRAAIAAGVSVTYKILFNDAIAMTGGQQVEGELSVPIIVRQLQAEGVKRIEVVADDPARLRGVPPGVPVSHRDDLDRVQRSLREEPGVTALIYDQVCATEKRRRRKRGQMEPAPRRILINPRVCEGCGDCSVASNCLSIVPIETEFGRKRAVDQASCNQDYSCVDGFCPSFVSVEGAALRREPARPMPDLAATPEPEVPALDAPVDIVVAGVGGSGVVTVAAVLGMAAHLEGRRFSIFDKLGMAQKYGAVFSHLRLSPDDDIPAIRIPDGQASVLIGGDLRCAAEPSVLRLLDRRRARILVASEQSIGGEFVKDRDFSFEDAAFRRLFRTFGAAPAEIIPARQLAKVYLGDELGANLLLLGFAWQRGWIPISRAAIERAIELNGVAVAMNRRAFELGRAIAHDADLAKAPAEAEPAAATLSIDALIARRVAHLTAYQNAAWAARYRRLVDEVRAAQARLSGASGDAAALTRAVAENFAKLMSYKDEYEVARLFTDGAFAEQLAQTFAGPGRLSFHLAPPLLGGDGEAPRKWRFGSWILPVFRVLARLKGLRGKSYDPFGWRADRREERALIEQYEADIRAGLARLSRDAACLAPLTALARLPEDIRGYGHVKRKSIAAATERRTELIAAMETRPTTLHAAE